MDLIDRQAAIDALDRIGSLDTEADKRYARSVFEALPSVQPQPCEDAVSRQQAIEKLISNLTYMHTFGADRSIDLIEELPAVQPQRKTDEWCTDCREYDQERHCCPRWNRVIRETLKDAQPEKRTDKHTETHACDCVSRQAAIDEIKAVYEWHDVVTQDRLIEHLKEMPSVQPQPIVRCKDCKWCEDADGSMCKNPASWVVATDRDFGCVLAERRTDEAD